MTVVEAYVGRKKIASPEDSSQFSVVVSSLLHEGIAQNTSGSVFPSKVLSLSLLLPYPFSPSVAQNSSKPFPNYLGWLHGTFFSIVNDQGP